MIDVISVVHDGDCPKCKFPETLELRNSKTGKFLGEMCSTFRSGKCAWFVLVGGK